jgi:hypothetical protein
MEFSTAALLILISGQPYYVLECSGDAHHNVHVCDSYPTLNACMAEKRAAAKKEPLVTFNCLKVPG